jgi:hypothetical protein
MELGNPLDIQRIESAELTLDLERGVARARHEYVERRGIHDPIACAGIRCRKVAKNFASK